MPHPDASHAHLELALSLSHQRHVALVPRVQVEVVAKEKLAGGLTKIEIRVANRGYLGTYGLSSAKKLAHSEPIRLTSECDGVKVTAPAGATIEIGHLDGWGRGLYNGMNIFAPWTRGTVHERSVTLVTEGKGKLKVRVGSIRVGHRILDIEVG